MIREGVVPIKLVDTFTICCADSISILFISIYIQLYTGELIRFPCDA